MNKHISYYTTIKTRRKEIKYFGFSVAKSKEHNVCIVLDYVGDIVNYVDR
jgi:hypothetical protein